jgi:pheromone shutdown-related protein TraB
MEMSINSKMIHRISEKDREIILLGTAHISKESVQLVSAVIEEENPDTVCVELCDSRYQALSKKDNWQNTDIFKVIKEKKALLLLSNLMLASFQKRLAKKLDMIPGEEMIAAIESAERLGAGICLVDRDIRITLTRTWRAMGFWDKIKLLFQLLFSLVGVEEIKEEDIERMKQEDVLETLLAEVGKTMPEIRTTLIDERDRYLSQKIKDAPGKKVVAVVGAGHMTGIKKYWETDIDSKALETLPLKSKWSTLVKVIIPAAIVALLIFGFFRGGTDAGTDMITWWILANGVLAGIGAMIALAHPLTILSSILAAPLTSLNPMIAAGWVSGLVEVMSRKPKVLDFERLPEDILSVKGFWRNKVTRVLLVVVFTNIGSIVGTFVAIPLMINVMS